MLGEGVDDTLFSVNEYEELWQPRTTHPDHYDGTIQQLLATSPPLQPLSAEVEHDDEDGGVSDECRSHDVMSGTLAQVASTAKAQCCSYTKKHLCRKFSMKCWSEYSKGLTGPA